jgi:two-component system NtrC family sensor kinase|tara:strand:- start:104 stop:1021 length:918 start_codon:yes stop_codon:yes gene_type:complete
MTDNDYLIAYEREKAARLAAEKLLETLTREVYFKNAELEKINREFKEQQQALIQQEKMASVGFLASGIAHEINNPLGYSLSNMSVLSEYIEELVSAIQTVRDDASIAETSKAPLSSESVVEVLIDMPDLVAESLDGLKAVKQIVSDLRGFARTNTAELTETNVNDCLTTTMNVLAAEIKRKAVLHVELKSTQLIDANAGKLNQVFANLIINAVHASPDKGNLYITTRDEDHQVVIDISDDGEGVPEEHRTEIFSPFFTSKPVGEGTGLGLSIAYAIIVEEHQGSLELAADGQGRGATFRIRLNAM